MGQRSREDLECLGRGKWRCRNCDAVLSEGAAARGPAGDNVSPVSAHSVPTKKTRAPPSPPLFADASFVLANETAPS